MSWYTISYKCGHEGREQIYGKTSDRQGRADWIGDHKVCPECYRDQQQAEKAQQSEAAAQINKAAGLPSLTGSDKQIAWAEAIRGGIISELAEIEAKINAHPDKRDANAALKLFPEFARDIRAKTEARWWIDHRQQTVQQTLAGGNPAAMLGMVFSGRGSATTWRDLWKDWMEAKHPEVVASVKAVAEAKRQAAAREKADAEFEAETERQMSVWPLIAAEPSAGEYHEETDSVSMLVEVSYMPAGGGMHHTVGSNPQGEWIELDGRRVYHGPEAKILRARVREHWAPIVEARLQSFRVGDRADSVVRPRPEDFVARSRDGREARGFVDHGEWAVYQVGSHTINSLHPECERIARESREQWKTQQEKKGAVTA